MMTAHDLVGHTLLGRYHVAEFLGSGGMAEVYRAWDAKRSVHVALKMLNEDMAEDYVFLRRFAREARVLERLQHPHIVRFFGFEESQRQAFLVMEYIDGVTLRRQLRLLGRPLTLPETLAVLQPVCSALHYAHRMGIYHCDVKPANIFIERGGRVVLGDFGIARLSESATVTFSTPGTPAYMAPEQCQGGEVDARTDVYSLGITAYEMMTLDRPFKGDTEGTTGSRGERVRWEQMNTPPPRPSYVNPGIPPAAEVAILRSLEKEPGRRQQQALDFCQEFSAGSGVRPGVPLSWEGAATPIPPQPGLESGHTQKPSRGVKKPGKPVVPWLVGGVGAVLGLVALAVLVVIALLVRPGGKGKDGTATPIAQLSAELQTATAQAVQEASNPTATPPPLPQEVSPSAQNIEPEPEKQLPTPEPTDTPIPTETFTPFPTPTSSPTPIPSPTRAPTPACPGVSGPFAGVWPAVQDRIGCATSSASTTWAAEEAFENGWMYWREDNDRMYAVYDLGSWEEFANAWFEGAPDFSCPDSRTPTKSPPTPLRGFGKTWCTYSGVRQGLGWATEGEHGFDVNVQYFERGWMLRTPRWAWIFYNDGSWQRK
jgi:serine/threonine protein kinase